MGGERFIENNIMRNRGQLGYADSICILGVRAQRETKNEHD